MSTPAAYDAIALAYQRTKASPVRAAVETWTLDRLLGPVAGLALLDAGCGEGFHARRLRDAGAARVAGVDVSPAMIGLARAAEAGQPRGIHYACAAVENLPDLYCEAHFDAVLAAYLLHYAPDVATLGRMCRRLAGALAPGGRLVALTENPDQAQDDYPRYAAYGFDKRALEPQADGSRIAYDLVAGRQLIRIETRWYSRQTYERALAAAGFSAVCWHPLELDPSVETPDYYAAYLGNPPVLGLTARLPGGCP